ncbi:TPA: HEPN domain-containing protein [Aeromonas hydrophila]
MSKAIQGFEYSIKDAEELLAHFDGINTNPPPPSSEVLKRAGLVMALTAWETYVEDRLIEEMHKKLAIVQGSYLGDFILKKLHADLKSFHNPTSDKTKKIFMDYLGFDVTEGWRWSNYEPDKARSTLNQWIKKRGEAAHRSKPISTGVLAPHLIKRDELEKVIRFIRDLVKSTDCYINEKIDLHHAAVFERQNQLST